ncbi:MAG: GYD domain-containing protein [Woeseiaceae bacterium]
MRRLFIVVAIALLGLSIAQAEITVDDDRYFLFVGEPNAAAWKYLMENPADREKEVAASMEAIGGKILSYYFGLGDGKNYITVQLPNDNEVIQAVYLMRLPSGLLNSYKVTELMPSAQMSEALKRSKKFIEMEKGHDGGVNE